MVESEKMSEEVEEFGRQVSRFAALLADLPILADAAIKHANAFIDVVSEIGQASKQIAVSENELRAAGAKIIADAGKTAASILDEGRLAKEAANSHCDARAAQLTELMADLAGRREELAKVNTEHARVEAILAELRAKIRGA